MRTQTQIQLIDFLLSNNKDLYGKIIELSSAISYKTSCVLKIINSILISDINSLAVYIDSDSHMCLQYLQDYNINIERCLLCNTNNPASIISTIEALKQAYQNQCRIILVIDSISNLLFSSPFKDLSKFVIQLSKLIYNTKITILAINQFRFSIDKNKFVRYCSKCFDLYCSLRLIIIEKQNENLYIIMQKNKITGYLGMSVINIGTNSNEQFSANHK